VDPLCILLPFIGVALNTDKVPKTTENVFGSFRFQNPNPNHERKLPKTSWLFSVLSATVLQHRPVDVLCSMDDGKKADRRMCGSADFATELGLGSGIGLRLWLGTGLRLRIKLGDG